MLNGYTPELRPETGNRAQMSPETVDWGARAPDSTKNRGAQKLIWRSA